MHRFFAIQLSALLCALLMTQSGRSGDTTSPEYMTDAKPLLTKHCYKCHSSIATEGDVRLDSHVRLTEGESPLVIAGDVDASRLLRVLRGDDGIQMPPSGPLSSDQIELLTRWVKDGAVGPPDGDETRVDHWAYRPLDLQSPTTVADNVIDSILSQEQHSRGLVLSREIDERLWLRRVYLDLVGLPPTPEQVSRFVSDSSNTKRTDVIDQLLGSSQHAERWARHWMDVWRYSDWDGYGNEIRESQPHIWRWREWIINSIEQNKPYDQMIVEMLAGDEMPGSNEQSLAATGFLARQWYRFNRNTWLENTIEHTSKAFMGVTMNCSKCHDHMYDPISQQEYYQFRAFFEPIDVRIDRVPGEKDSAKDGLARIFDKQLDKPTYIFHRGNEKSPLEDAALQANVPAVFGLTLPTIEPIDLRPDQFYAARKTYVIDETRAELKQLLDAAKQSFDESMKADPQSRTTSLARLRLESARLHLAAFEAKVIADDLKYGAGEVGEANVARYVLHNAYLLEIQAKIAADSDKLANWEAELADAKAKPEAEQDAKKLEELRGKIKEATDHMNQAAGELLNDDGHYTPLSEVYPATSSGRRYALARWLVEPKHPLTARVAINHIWLRHFGKPLVETTFDFGLNGKPPASQQLLDALAIELIRSGWDMKHIHRLITTSRIYRSVTYDATVATSNAAIDPHNDWYWQFPVRRMEAEVVRDSILVLAGELDLARGGPDLDQTSADTTHRRSIYYRCSKEKRSVYLSIFDAPNVVSCYRRDETIVPHQALALMNSDFNLKHAETLATKLLTQLQNAKVDATDLHGEFIKAAFVNVLGREARPEEIESARRFIAVQSAIYRGEETKTNELSKSADQTENSSVAPDQEQNATAQSGEQSSPADVSAQESDADDSWHKIAGRLVLILFNHHEFITIP